jgi:hypothetical protein
MLKSLFFTLFLVLTLTFSNAKATLSQELYQKTLFIAEATIESPEAQANPSPSAPAKSNLDQPDDNEQKTDSAKVDLSSDRAAKPQVSSSPVSYPSPPHPYDMEAIKKFNEELYGEGN